jgi:hypothetical protein
MDHSEKREYFTKKGKTEEEIKAHNLGQAKKHKDRMKNYYKKRKIAENGKVKDEFQKLYQVMNSLGGYADIGEVDTKMENMAVSKYKCLCFDKILEAYNVMIEEEKKNAK